MLKYRLNIDDEWKLGTPICFFLIGLYLRNATVEMTFLSDNAKNIFSVSIRAIILVSFMIAIPIIFRRAARRMVLLIFAIVLGIILHALIFPANNIFYWYCAEIYDIYISHCNVRIRRSGFQCVVWQTLSCFAVSVCYESYLSRSVFAVWY